MYKIFGVMYKPACHFINKKPPPHQADRSKLFFSISDGQQICVLHISLYYRWPDKTYFSLCLWDILLVSSSTLGAKYFIRVVGNCIYCKSPFRQIFVCCFVSSFLCCRIMHEKVINFFFLTGKPKAEKLMKIQGRYMNKIKITLSELRLWGCLLNRTTLTQQRENPRDPRTPHIAWNVARPLPTSFLYCIVILIIEMSDDIH